MRWGVYEVGSVRGGECMRWGVYEARIRPI